VVQVIKMLMVVVTMFGVCWLPLHVAHPGAAPDRGRNMLSTVVLWG